MTIIDLSTVHFILSFDCYADIRRPFSLSINEARQKYSFEKWILPWVFFVFCFCIRVCERDLLLIYNLIIHVIPPTHPLVWTLLFFGSEFTKVTSCRIVDGMKDVLKVYVNANVTSLWCHIPPLPPPHMLQSFNAHDIMMTSHNRESYPVLCEPWPKATSTDDTLQISKLSFKHENIFQIETDSIFRS